MLKLAIKFSWFPVLRKVIIEQRTAQCSTVQSVKSVTRFSIVCYQRSLFAKALLEIPSINTVK